ncbi:MAG TPA: sulfotransferase [Rhizomicrobium sp.]|nr:sulfotransferase [Rhizomicrobium sp.]
MVFDPYGAAQPDRAIGEIVAAMRAGDYERAASIANLVLAHGRHHPIVYNARGLAHQQKGRHREALAEFMQARTLAPNDVNLQNAIGVCFVNLGQLQDALRAFDDAIALDPNNAQPYYRKGWTLELAGEADKSTMYYERAVALDPNHADALGTLAASYASAGKIEEARAFAERSLQINPGQPTATVALGIVSLAEKDYAEAERRFRAVMNPVSMTARGAAILQGLLADALDGQNRVEEAFAAYGLEKAAIRALHEARYRAFERPGTTVDRIASCVENAPPETWSSAASGALSPADRHVFLLGFARSGTTLLEQVLASHPGVAALEEQDLLVEAGQLFLADQRGLDRLTAADEAELDVYRDAYWQGVLRTGLDVRGKVFVDKLPMNTIKLPLIARLFPNARIVFALRDPRDVVQSCYRRHFEINPVNFEFLSLEDAASLYAAVMRLGAICRAKLPLAFLEHRYEDMISDFDNSAAAVCAFIGVEWSEALRDFHRKDTGLDVRSPSAAQIRRPLYDEGVGQWRRYREQLKPVLPVLEPWIGAFGYPRE